MKLNCLKVINFVTFFGLNIIWNNLAYSFVIICTLKTQYSEFL